MILYQSFHWHTPPDGQFWNKLASQADMLSKLGITHVWIPPCYKAAEGNIGVGYSVYDLYDLGEFDQKGSIRTKYGTRDELQRCIDTLHAHQLAVVADIVLNHRMGADEHEKVPVKEVDPNRRNEFVSGQMDKELPTKFTFPGRGQQYSSFTYDYHLFSGIRHDGKMYKIINGHGDQWQDNVDTELQNFDYLVGADLDYRSDDLKQELLNWGRWFIQTGIDGFRIDAVKHMDASFTKEWIDAVRTAAAPKQLFILSEFLDEQTKTIIDYHQKTGNSDVFYDMPLHNKLHAASEQGAAFDLRQLLEQTLVHDAPAIALTFVDNHDTQPLQPAQSFIQAWFKPAAYAFTLLRSQGIPSVFMPDLWGCQYTVEKDGQQQNITLAAVPGLYEMMLAKNKITTDKQETYAISPHLIGWSHQGNPDKPETGMAVLLCNSEGGNIDMLVGRHLAGKVFVNLLQPDNEPVTINNDGYGKFYVTNTAAAVWCTTTARDQIQQQLATMKQQAYVR